MKRLIAIILLLGAVVWVNIGGEDSGQDIASESQPTEDVYEADPEETLEFLSEEQAEMNFNENHMAEESVIEFSDTFRMNIVDGGIALVNVAEDGHLFDVPDGTSTPVIGLDVVVENGGTDTEKLHLGQSTLVTSTGEQLDAVAIYETPENTFRGGTSVDEGVTFLLRDSMPTHVEWVDWYVRYDGEEVKHRIEFDGFSGF